MDLRERLAERRDAIVEKWFAETVKHYPARTVRFLCTEADRFRNPVGCSLRDHLAVLFDAGILCDDRTRAERALGELVRLQAVQDLEDEDGTAFLGALRSILRPVTADDRTPEIDARIDQLALVAARLHANCREEMRRLAASEARRRTWVRDRVARKQG